MGRGRPSISGKRYKGGKRVPVFMVDRGADHVQALRARFAGFQRGKAGDQVSDPIGRAWAVGLLENARVDPAVLRDAGRAYAQRYWGHYPSSSGVANYTCEVRKGPTSIDGADPMGEKFNAMDRLLTNAGLKAHSATQSLCVDFHWFPDANPSWLERLINDRLAKAGLEDQGPLNYGDAEQMAMALEGLLALAGESERIAA